MRNTKMDKYFVILAVIIGAVIGDVSEKARLSRVYVDSKYQGLEAPLVEAAATSEQRQTIPTNHNSDEDDEDSLERLCKDAFHDFLCKTFGPRKNRIDGRLRPGAQLPPGVVLPVATNLKEQVQPFGSASAFLPSSVKSDRSYLPPPSQAKPTASPEPQYVPPFEPQPSAQVLQKVPSKPSNYYLPDVPSAPKPNQVSSTIIPLPNAYIPSVQQTTEKQLVAGSSNENPLTVPAKPQNTYLPVEDQNVSPESTNLSPSIAKGASSPKQHSQKDDEESHTLERLCNDPFHSFLCKPIKPRQRIDGRIRPGAIIPPNVLLGSSSIIREAKLLPSQEGGSSNNLPLVQEKPKQTFDVPNRRNVGSYTYTIQHSNSFADNSQNGYQYQKPNTQYVYPSTTTSTAFPSTSSSSITPNPFYQQSNPTNIQENYNQAPNTFTTLPSTSYSAQTFTSTRIPTTYQTSTTNQQTTLQTSFPTPTGKPISIKDFQILMQNNFQNRPNGQNGYQYQKPSNPLTTTTTKPTNGQTYNPSFQQMVVDYHYQRPSNILQNYFRPNDYQTPTSTYGPTTIQTSQKPIGDFTQQNGDNRPSAQATYTTRPTFSITTFQTTQKPVNYYTQPTSIQNGYIYNKPSYSLMYTPMTTKRPFTAQTTQTPVAQYQYQQPSNLQQNVVKPLVQSGYNYEKPSTGFTYSATFPTTQTPSTFQTTQKPAGYYQPTGVVKPSGQSGYVYDKFSTTRPTTYQTPQQLSTFQTTQKPGGYQYQQPTNIQQSVVKPAGYVYNKPSVPFTYSTTLQTTTFPPTTQRPSTFQTTQKPNGYQYQQPTNIQQTVVNPAVQNGYFYNKPSIPFTHPTTFQTTTQRPSTFITTQKPSVFHQSQQPTNLQENVVRPTGLNGYIYNRPSIPFTYSTTLATTTFSPTTQRPSTFQTTQKPSVYYQYPEPTNIQQSVMKPVGQDGYFYNKPSNPFTYSTTTFPTTQRPSTFLTTQKPSVFYQNQESTNLQQNVVRPTGQNGYVYNKPSNPFTYSTASFPTTTTTTKRPTTFLTTQKPSLFYQYQQPSNIQQNVVKPTGQDGYVYNKPSTPFTYPTTTTQRPSTFPTTQKPSLFYQYQQPSNIQQNVVKPTGQDSYVYNKPSIPFTYSTTTTKRPTTFQTTQKPSLFNQYQQPSNIQQNVVRPTSEEGYVYNKPSISFTYSPTTQRPTTFPTTQKPSLFNQYQQPSNIQQNVVRPTSEDGYVYNKPLRPFIYSTTHHTTTYRPPTTTTTFQTTKRPFSTHKPTNLYQEPSNHRPDYSDENGYTYSRPSKPLTLSSEYNSQETYPESQSVGYEYQASAEEHPQPNFRFGDRIKPRTKPTSNTISYDDDFKPLRNFELI